MSGIQWDGNLPKSQPMCSTEALPNPFKTPLRPCHTLRRTSPQDGVPPCLASLVAVASPLSFFGTTGSSPWIQRSLGYVARHRSTPSLGGALFATGALDGDRNHPQTVGWHWAYHTQNIPEPGGWIQFWNERKVNLINAMSPEVEIKIHAGKMGTLSVPETGYFKDESFESWTGVRSPSVSQQCSSFSNHPSKLVQTTSEQQVVDSKEFPFMLDHEHPS